MDARTYTAFCSSFIFASVLLILSACVPQVQTHRASQIEQAKIGDTMFYAADGVALPYKAWLPAKKPRAVIVALHGFNDYHHAFELPGRFFAGNGVATYAYDQRGFGGAPETGIWAGRDNLVNDLRAFIVQVKQRHVKTPVYLLGESMGGAVVVTALADPDFPQVDGLVLVAPALWGGQTLPPLYRASLWLTAHTIPSYEFTGERLKILACNNIPLMREMSKDPKVLKRSRADAIYGLVHIMDEAYGRVPDVHVPVLMLYGGKDEVIPKPPIAQSLGRFGQPILFAYYPEGYHMLLRDLQREEVMQDILSWMQDPNAALPSGFVRNALP